MFNLWRLLLLVCAGVASTPGAVAGEGVCRGPAPDLAVGRTAAHCPGGSASYTGHLDRNAFSHPSANLPSDRRLDFKVGQALFERLWVTAPSSTQAADGLGPLYNARSCRSCHPRNGRGRPPDGPEDRSVSLVLRVDVPAQDEAQRQLLAAHRVNNIPEPVYGHQLQTLAIAGQQAEYRLGVSFAETPVTLSDGKVIRLRAPTYRVEQPGYGTPHPQARFSPRVAPQLIGLGLLEAVAVEDVLAWADPDDRDGDGISGTPNWVWSREYQKIMLGRFGHKAGMPSVNEQSQSAFATDIGIGVPLFPDPAGDCTPRQNRCREAPNGNSPQYGNLEADQTVTELVAFYTGNLSVPARRRPADPEVRAGERLFQGLGCAACHRPEMVTPSQGVAPRYRRQVIRPYTDLLLHDLGEGLADGRPEGAADGREWRTAPLWGIGLSGLVNGNTNYLHDGRARSVLEAILWHGGEARAQRDAVIALSAGERHQLLNFVESL